MRHGMLVRRSYQTWIQTSPVLPCSWVSKDCFNYLSLDNDNRSKYRRGLVPMIKFRVSVCHLHLVILAGTVVFNNPRRMYERYGGTLRSSAIYLSIKGQSFCTVRHWKYANATARSVSVCMCESCALVSVWLRSCTRPFNCSKAIEVCTQALVIGIALLT